MRKRMLCLLLVLVMCLLIISGALADGLALREAPAYLRAGDFVAAWRILREAVGLNNDPGHAETPEPAETIEPTETPEHTKTPKPTETPEPMYTSPPMPERKPVIYLYPEEPAEIAVTLGRADAITVSYPAYGDGWRVTAQPDGTLTDARGREYYSLYYEANAPAPAAESGFVVTGKDVQAFLEEKLSALGLTDKEAQELIIYWLPQMQAWPYVFVHFAVGEEVDASMPLTIEPAPDSILRVWMMWQGLDGPAEVEQQVLPTFERTGFTVVEWGGIVLPDRTVK